MGFVKGSGFLRAFLHWVGSGEWKVNENGFGVGVLRECIDWVGWGPWTTKKGRC